MKIPVAAGAVAHYPDLVVRRLQARAVDIPVDRPVHTAAGTLKTTPLLLIDLHTEQGITGHAYLRSYSARALEPLRGLVTGVRDLLHGESASPEHLSRVLRHEFALTGLHGLIGLVLAGIDMCAWDIRAKALQVPLHELTGGSLRDVPAYAPIRSMDAAAAEAEAVDAAQAGYRAVKLKLGPQSIDDDFHVVTAVRAAIGSGIAIMVDFNQSLDRDSAGRHLRRLAELEVLWIEEPIGADDIAGHAGLREAGAVPVALGENSWGPESIRNILVADACDQLVLDLGRVGGVTGWRTVAALPEAAGFPVANHTFPEVSIHLLASTTSQTSVWFESIDHAGPILAEPVIVEDGLARPTSRVGNGISWDEAAVHRWLV